MPTASEQAYRQVFGKSKKEVQDNMRKYGRPEGSLGSSPKGVTSPSRRGVPDARKGWPGPGGPQDKGRKSPGRAFQDDARDMAAYRRPSKLSYPRGDIDYGSTMDFTPRRSPENTTRLLDLASEALSATDKIMGMFGVRSQSRPDEKSKKMLEGLRDVGDVFNQEQRKPDFVFPTRDMESPGVGKPGGRREEPEPWHLFSPYGGRKDPGTGEWRQHAGVDAGPAEDRIGTEIPAVAEGVVKEVYPDWWGTAGKTVVVEDPNTGYEYIYKHLDEIWVQEGDRVDFSQPVGTMGNTGRTFGQVQEGAHLDLEIRDQRGQTVDSLPWLKRTVPIVGYEDYYTREPYNPLDTVPAYAGGGLNW